MIKHRLFNIDIFTLTRSKRLHDNSTIFSAEATAIMLTLEYYAAQSTDTDIESEESNHHLTCRLIGLLYGIYNKSTLVCFCWIPSHCGIEVNELVDQKAKDLLNENMIYMARIHYADLIPQVNPYIQNLVQINGM